MSALDRTRRNEKCSRHEFPVPDSDTTCGLPVLKSLIVSDPVRVPVAVGLKSTFTVQLAPAPRDAVQVLLEMWKSPLVAILEIPRRSVAGLKLLTVID
jgi:hypothetical protein